MDKFSDIVFFAGGYVDYTASIGQQAIWFLHRLNPDHRGHHICVQARPNGEVIPDAAAAAFQGLVDRHPVLRTTFHSVDGVLWQRVWQQAKAAFAYIDASDWGPDEFDACLAQEISKPFDLETGPLFRTLLYKAPDGSYRLLICMHHSITDMWSFALLLYEGDQLYRAAVAGIEPKLKPLRLEYTDFTKKQAEMLAGPEGERLQAYWRDRLAGEPAPLELPYDHSTPSNRFPSGSHGEQAGHETLILDERLEAELRALCEELKIPVYVPLLAAYQIVLGRYSHTDDVPTAFLSANRSRETARTFGYFVNPILVRTDLTGNPTFTDLVCRLHNTLQADLAHAAYPFPRIVEGLGETEALPGQTPWLRAAFSWQKTTPLIDNQRLGSIALDLQGRSVPAGGLDLVLMDQPVRYTPFELMLLGAESLGEIAVTCEYRLDLYTPERIQRMLGHLRTLLEATLAHPQQRLSELPMLSAAERLQQLVEWNATDREIPDPGGVHRLVAASAAQSLQAVAVRDENASLTYAQLLNRAAQIRSILQSAGVARGSLVAVCLPRSADLVATLLAIWQAGAAYLPLDPSHPSRRLEAILEDSGAAALVADRSLEVAERLAASATAGPRKIVYLEMEMGPPGGEASPDETVSADDLAYVIYTSGSTGAPKGVQVTHGALTNLLAGMQAEPGCGAEGVLLAVTTIAFDIATLEIFLPLISGGQVVIAGEETAADGRRLAAALTETQASILQATPATWRMLIEAGWPGSRGLKALCGGEALPPELAAQLLPRVGELWNLYGPTETTIWSTIYRVEPAHPEAVPAAERIPIGRPIANTQVYVLDRHGQPAPVGVTGELYIGGAGVARGYLNRPELTAGRFLPDPFRPELGARLYRTGDLARYRPDGNLEFLGREDLQEKIRGFRIELDEIETALSRHPDVLQAVAHIAPGRAGGPMLFAAVVSNPEAGPAALTAVELRAVLQEQLPAYMIPRRFIFLERLPLTTNRKIDRPALIRIAMQEAEAEGLIVPARSPIESELIEIWQQVLQTEPVGIHDNFFLLGGHSLTATQIMSRIQKTLDVDLPLRALFEAPTIAGLAEQVRRALTGGAAAIPPIVPVARDEPLPLSYSQERMWFIQQLDPQNAAYNVPLAVRITGPLDVKLLEDCLNTLIRRYEILRTNIRVVAGRPEQVIAAGAHTSIETFDLRAAPAAERETQMERLLQAEAAGAFDLENGPSLRVRLVRLADEEYTVMINMHHAITDAWSIRVLIRELTALYQTRREGKSPELPEPALQFADFAAWQRRRLSGTALEPQLEYWRQQLDRIGALALPTSYPRPARQSYRGAVQTRKLSPELIARLQAFGKQENATPFMVTLAAFAALLYRYSGQTDFAVGMPIANRHWLDSEDLLGTFVNTLVLRHDLSEDPTFREFGRRVRETVLQAFANQDVPFERLAAELQPRRDTSLTPFFQVMFNFTDIPAPQGTFAGLEWEPLVIDRHASQFDLTLSISKVNNEHTLSVEYSTDLFAAPMMERLLDHYCILLDSLLAKPEQRLSQLELLTPAEKRRLLVDWNATQVEFGLDQAVHTLFEQQAERTPQATALLYEGVTTTYAELSREANRLANHLQTLGIGPRSLVGVYLERSPAMIAALLGVLKTGAAYVPMDPKYPRARLTYMLNDSQATVLLTQSSLAENLGKHSAQIVQIDGDRAQIAAQPDTDPGFPVTLDDLAYVIYTSGSTGEPKGVQGLHRGVVNRMRWMWQAFPFRPGEICCQKTALSFVDSIWEIFGPLLQGVPLAILPEASVGDPEALVAELGRQRVARIVLVPSLLRVLLESHPDLAQRLPNLQMWTTSGETISPELARLFFERMPRRMLLNLYGCSEASADSTYCVLQPEYTAHAAPIGRPIANTQIYILDDHYQPVPIGIPGEIYIGGDGLARGYHRRPEMTAEKFPTLSVDGSLPQRLYRSGDLGRYREDGQIEYLGRRGSQVKVRGFRIELGEVESNLLLHPAVRQAIVRAFEERPEMTSLAAYIVLEGAADPSAGDELSLRRFLAERLPDYMIPRRFVFIDQVPLLPNGKIDAAALPRPEAHRTATEPPVAPRNAFEARLSRVWNAVLDIETVGIQDNFFDLGGHSLLAINLLSEVEREFGRQLAVATIFQTPTVESMARLLQEVEDTYPGESAVVAIQPGGRRLPFFCVHGFGGGVTDYHDLARLLGDDQPFYGLQARGLEDNQEPHTRIEDMAAYFIEQMRTVQPKGPYRVGGYCFGGIVAYEMARQLESQGEQADLVAIFEGYAPVRIGLRTMLKPSSLRNFFHNLPFWLSDYSNLVFGERLARLARKSRFLAKQLARLAFIPRRIDLRDVMDNVERIPANSRRLMNIELKAQLSYMPGPIQGQVTLFRVQGLSLFRSFDLEMGWGRLALGGVEVKTIEGSHGDIIFAPHVNSLAEKLGESLETCETAREPKPGEL